MRLIQIGMLVVCLCCCVACTTSSSAGGGGAVFASVGVIKSVEATPMRYVGGTVEVDVAVFENLNVGTVNIWVTDPSLTVTPLAHTKTGSSYAVSYVAPANTSLTGVDETYTLRVEVQNPDGVVLIDHNYGLTVPAMQLPPNPPTF